MMKSTLGDLLLPNFLPSDYNYLELQLKKRCLVIGEAEYNSTFIYLILFAVRKLCLTSVALLTNHMQFARIYRSLIIKSNFGCDCMVLVCGSHNFIGITYHTILTIDKL